jgi:hypothetical protein
MSQENAKNSSEVTNQGKQQIKDGDSKQPLGALLQMLSITHKSSNATLGGVIAEKMSQEQVPLFFEHIERHEMEEHKNTRLTTILSFLTFCCVLLFFALIVVFLKDASLTKEIVIGLLSFIGGGGLGFGIGKMQNKD